MNTPPIHSYFVLGWSEMGTITLCSLSIRAVLSCFRSFIHYNIDYCASFPSPYIVFTNGHLTTYPNEGDPGENVSKKDCIMCVVYVPSILSKVHITI